MSDYQELSGYQLLLRRAQEHKVNPTSSEKVLLEALNIGLPNLAFQFQVVMIPFIVDFVSLLKMVIIEVDGSSHDGAAYSDMVRQKNLERDGYSFIRFTHNQVMESTSQVLGAIEQFCNLHHSDRRSGASPETEFVKRGKTIFELREANPLAGIHTRSELEFILSEQDPYDIWEDSVKSPIIETATKHKILCVICTVEISPHEPRKRDFTNDEFVLWIHKRCRG